VQFQCMLLAFLISLQNAIPPPVSPDDHARLAAQFLSDANRSIPQDAKPYVRFLSWQNYAGSPDLEQRTRIMRFWINSLHLESDPEFPRELAGSNGLLSYIDLRDYGWTPAAWLAVAQREPYFRQPAVSSGAAQFIRVVIGANQDPNTFHAVGIVRADWFFRETVELDRSPAYYDLLFAKQRHPDGTETEERIIDHKGGWLEASGQVVEPGRYSIKVPKGSKFVDFPKTEGDVEKALGVDGIRAFIKTSGINLQHGAVVEGGEKGNSVVARQNRLLERTNGPIGYYWKTFDVKETSGKRDFAETLHKDFAFDAGEILFRLPGGGQGGLLVDSGGNVLNVADNRFAIDGSDSKDVRVRNPGSCMVCHESGIIKPANLIEEMLKSGVDIKFKDKKESRDARSFFLGWESKLINDQQEYAGFIKRTSGYSPAENSRHFKAFRDSYDGSVSLDGAARECGVPVPVLLAAARKSLKARVLNLCQGISCPRRTFESDVYPELVKLLRAK